MRLNVPLYFRALTKLLFYCEVVVISIAQHSCDSRRTLLPEGEKDPMQVGKGLNSAREYNEGTRVEKQRSIFGTDDEKIARLYFQLGVMRNVFGRT